jgi:RecA/RadA recombinase
MSTEKNKDKLTSFFKTFADADAQLDFKMAHETVGEKVPAISTGSLALDDALSSGGLPKGRLIQYYGAPGCHAAGQGILMSNGSVKKVEDIKKGDVLMGPDGPRKVLRLLRGVDKMYKIHPVKGKSFTANENHVLTLSKYKKGDVLASGKIKKSRFEIIDVTLKEWLSWNDYKKSQHKLVRSRVDEFYNSYNLKDVVKNELPIDPYILGVLIGDGSLMSGLNLTTADDEILNEFKSQTFRAVRAIRGVGKKINLEFDKIKKMGLNVKSGYKFIPNEYKTSSIFNRLEILAGLLDTDGSYFSGGFDYISKSEVLSNDVAFLSRSVGLAAYVSSCEKSAYPGHCGTYYRVSISGDCSIIPTRIERKKAKVRRQVKDVLHTGFSAEFIGEDKYYGFTLSDDGRYLLDDFTITHNSGKTLITMIAIKEAQKADPTAQQLFIDSEQTFSTTWAETLGLDTSKIIVVDGDTAVNGRKCFEMLLGVPKEDQKHILKGKSKEGLLDKITQGEFNINLIVLDSLGSIIPPGEDVSAIGKSNMALLARFLTTTFRKLALDISKANVPFIIINHKRDNMDPYGSDHTFSGGNTYAHFLSANIYFEAVQRKDSMIVDEKENKIGHPIRATIEKSKFGPWPRKCEFKVDFSKGIIDRHQEIIALALNYDIITKPTSMSYEYKDQKWVGAAKLEAAVESNPELAEELIKAIEDFRDNKWKAQKAKQEAINNTEPTEDPLAALEGKLKKKKAKDE